MASVTNHSRYLASHLDPARPGHSYAVMKKRPLGGTGLLVGEIGLGLSGLSRGADPIPDAEALATIAAALDAQASLVDVAPSYGTGRGLHLLAAALKGRRAQAQVCLKAGYAADGATDYSPAGVRRSLEQSLKALGTDRVEVLLLHNPPAPSAGSGQGATDDVWAELTKLKQQGKLLAFGASLTGPDQLKAALDKTPAQVLQLPLNVFCQDNAAVLDAAFKKRVGIIVNRPLDSGWLAGRYGAHHLFFDERSRWSMAEKARRADLQAEFEAIALRPNILPAQAALAFVLSHPQVSCAIPGASGWQQVIANLDAGQLRLDPAVIAKLKDLWDKKVKSSPLPL